MIIVPMTATLKRKGLMPSPEEHIEECGRTAYQSQDKITTGSAAKFIKMIIKRGHLSVLEHASASVHFEVDRGITHEMVRHRIATFTQESTRYCRYGEDIRVIEPPGLDIGQTKEWYDSACFAEGSYHRMLKSGCKPEIARSVLPTCLKAEITMTCNFREWLLVFSLRTAMTAHPQIREVMLMAQDQLAKVAPHVFCLTRDD